MKRSCFVHGRRLGIVARGITFTTPGEAQFICVQSTTEGEPQGGAGGQNIATGNFANASGIGSFNTAGRDNVL